MKQHKGKIFFTLGLIVGFILASHWNFGRNLFLKYSPLRTDAVGTASQVLIQNAGEAVDQMKQQSVKQQ